MEEGRKQRQPACKPGSVWPGFCPRRDGHSSGTPVAGRLEQPTRATRPTDEAPPAAREPRAHRSYSVLLPAGLAVPPTLPPARCALAAPFHPCPCARPCGRPDGRFAFCGALPGVAPAGRYPAPHPFGARTFLRLKSGGRPADWLNRHMGAVARRSRRKEQSALGLTASARPREGAAGVHCSFTRSMGLMPPKQAAGLRALAPRRVYRGRMVLVLYGTDGSSIR
jgi:hypothetical protein